MLHDPKKLEKARREFKERGSKPNGKPPTRRGAGTYAEDFTREERSEVMDELIALGKTRYLFLDIDGVLNGNDWLMDLKDDGLRWRRARQINPEAVARLNRIVDALDCKIVISSSWRGDQELPDILRAKGLTGEIVGVTPHLDDYRLPRGSEIQAWMDANDVHHRQIVILDDDDDMAHLLDRLVRTSMREGGLLDKHIDLAIAMF